MDPKKKNMKKVKDRAMKKQFVFMITAMLLLGAACQQGQQQGQPKPSGASASDTISVVQLSKSDRADTLFVDFKILDASGKKKFVDNLHKGSFSVSDVGALGQDIPPQVDSITDIRERKIISDQISMLFLVDRSGSISQDELLEQYAQICRIIEILPNTKIYLSFMDSTVTPSLLATQENMKFKFFEEFEVKTGTEKYLYKAIMAKMEELSGTISTHYPEIPHNPALQDSTQKMLFVFTDGCVVNPDGTFIGADFFKWKGEIWDLSEKQAHSEIPYVPIHCIYIGDPAATANIKDEMEALCASAPTKDALKGQFHTLFDVAQLQETLMGTIDSIAADYRLVLLNPDGKTYDGTQHTLTVTLRDNANVLAQGIVNYAFGNQHVPIVVASDPTSASNSHTILSGLLYGLIFILLVYLILQYLVPWIKYKMFCKKYIVEYRRGSGDSSVERQHCYHCKEPFEDGDKIVVKCEHVVHLECWEENRNRCPEYGIHNCSKGIHYYNKERLSDPRNAPYFVPWLVYGLATGLVSWLFMRLFYSEILFAPMITKLVVLMRPIDAQMGLTASYVSKIQSMLLCGLLLGFFITLFFNYQIEFRKKNLKIWGQMLLRALIGSAVGFVAFLLGAIVIILLGKSTNCIYTDWIPWALFAVGIAFTLSFKTDINLRSALIGGLISVLISFVVLYMATFAKEVISMFSYMIYAAGFGIAVAVVHFVSEKYFLRISGPVKERDIAIYKWMSVTGGFNRVTIGKSIDCILEMNWDNAENIADKQVEIYLENDRPYCKALSDGTRLASGQMLQKGQTILLNHGTEFTIGNTLFTYIEKDK